MSPDALRRRLQAYLNDRGCAFTIGTRGALAEFCVLAGDEPAGEGLAVVTDRGAIALDPPASARLESRGDDRLDMVIAAAEAGMSARVTVTEVGPDPDPVRPEDAEAVLFDLGLNLPFVDVCVRSRNDAMRDLLRGWCGRRLGDVVSAELAELKRASPHRVFASRAGRIEVYQPIPARHERSPDGPHTHLHPGRLPRLSRVDPTAPVSCLTVYLSHGGR